MLKLLSSKLSFRTKFFLSWVLTVAVLCTGQVLIASVDPSGQGHQTIHASSTADLPGYNGGDVSNLMVVGTASAGWVEYRAVSSGAYSSLPIPERICGPRVCWVKSIYLASTASSSAPGVLSSADYAKLAAFPGSIASGTANYLSKFTGTNAIGNSQVRDDGSTVAIGAAPSTAMLYVNGLFDNAGINNGNGTYTYLRQGGWDSIGAKNDGEWGTVFGGPGSGYTKIFFYTGGTERAQFDSSGNLSIGTTAHGAKLEVNGQIKIDGGSPATGYVLTSNSAGLGTWTIPPVVSATLPLSISTASVISIAQAALASSGFVPASGVNVGDPAKVLAAASASVGWFTPGSIGLQPTVDWHSTLPTAADHVPTYITSARGIDLTYDSFNNSIAVGTNFPVVDWYATLPAASSYVPAVIKSARGVDLTYDSYDNSIAVGTNFPPPDPITDLTSGINFAATYASASVTQTDRAAGNNASSLNILAQGAAQSGGNTATGGDLNLYSGASGLAGDIDGSVNIGVGAFSGVIPGSAQLLCQGRSASASPDLVSSWDFQASLVKQTSGSPAEHHEIARLAGFAMQEDIYWFQTTAAGAVNFDIPAAVNGAYQWDVEIMSKSAGTGLEGGYSYRRWGKRVSAIITVGNGATIADGYGGAMTPTFANLDNNNVRLSITSTNSTTWTVKVLERIVP